MWKTRVDKEPPPQFWADFVAATNVIFPNATLERETLTALYRLAVEEWREGRQVHVIVRQLCSCDGQTVVPSPAAERKLGKTRRVARPPESAKRGQIFGVEELRDPAAVGKLLGRLALIQARLSRARGKKQTPARSEEIARLEAEAIEVGGQIEAARQSAFWRGSRSRVAEPTAADPPAKRGRRGRRSGKEPPATSPPPALPPLPPEAVSGQTAPGGFDDDIAADLINTLAKKA